MRLSERCVASEAVADVSEALSTFDPNDLGDLRRVLDPLLFEAGALDQATALALARFVARSWDDIVEDLGALFEVKLSIPP